MRRQERPLDAVDRRSLSIAGSLCGYPIRIGLECCPRLVHVGLVPPFADVEKDVGVDVVEPEVAHHDAVTIEQGVDGLVKALQDGRALAGSAGVVAEFVEHAEHSVRLRGVGGLRCVGSPDRCHPMRRIRTVCRPSDAPEIASRTDEQGAPSPATQHIVWYLDCAEMRPGQFTYRQRIVVMAILLAVFMAGLAIENTTNQILGLLVSGIAVVLSGVVAFSRRT